MHLAARNCNELKIDTKTKNQKPKRSDFTETLRISQYSQRSTQQEQREINGLRIDKITCSVTQPAMECAQQQQ